MKIQRKTQIQTNTDTNTDENTDTNTYTKQTEKEIKIQIPTQIHTNKDTDTETIPVLPLQPAPATCAITPLAPNAQLIDRYKFLPKQSPQIALLILLFHPQASLKIYCNPRCRGM